ncbi:aquaporin Z [Arthrobacter sp. MYb211]|uniref:aquaporin Z n=1 Tax=Micrococcaceae TaxID=1268 RepID=UPI000CFB5FD7|nr:MULTISPECIES: aquaporin Z [unclassified Arthrobacter]PRA00265.1 aquaporin Z [Arthrobacter sp. MYb224]PRA04455.1 aquaporin Z [Arthrobacter sp. MYb229]PRA12192.1 aquaporin Z [Arthrobacter sp. MYb221]PRB51632.1 aquaporin Z [Arthrobacter sp. MYb216]PRC08655.1 aquaporin Z [Arthrobacter sp. MYb211]
MSQSSSPTMGSRLTAEFLGTFVLVFGGCGSAIFAAQVLDGDTINMGIGFLGVALAFGLTVLVMVYAVGHISGGHFNPAVTLGAALAKRVEWKAVPAYMITQVIAASVAGAVLLAIASGKDGFNAAESGFASNGYADRSPDGYSLVSALVAEIVLTAIFLYVILGSTDRRAPAGFAGVSIGLSLTLIHLISIPITNTSVNPARSLGVAWFAGPEALGQVWLFIVAPLIGAAIAGVSYSKIFSDLVTAEAAK